MRFSVVIFAVLTRLRYLPSSPTAYRTCSAPYYYLAATHLPTYSLLRVYANRLATPATGRGTCRDDDARKRSGVTTGSVPAWRVRGLYMNCVR